MSTTTSPVPLAESGTIEATSLSSAYRVGLVVVCIAMLLLPLVYVGIIALASAAVWWHVTHDTWLVNSSSAQFGLLLYAAPAVAGIVVVFFLIKPILARPEQQTEPLKLSPDQEPELFAFIRQICRQVRAPEPRHVYVDCVVNASASFERGVSGLRDEDLVLTIGLPLVAGLSVRQFGGVLAHEFGHFAQGGGLRLTTLIRSLNGWFARVVHQRDRWDTSLTSWSREGDWRVIAVIRIAQGGVWLSRQVLAKLMWLGHLISCFMMRQMEFDADSYEVKIAGSDSFARTCERLAELTLAQRYAMSAWGEALNQRTLPADLTAFLIASLARVPDSARADARTQRDAPTQRFDTHPSVASRVRAAEALACSGVLVGGAEPARALFRNFAALSMEATRHQYERRLGIPLDAVTLVDVEDVFRAAEVKKKAFDGIEAFFAGALSPSRPLRIDIEPLQHLSDTEIVDALHQERDAMAAIAKRVSGHYRAVEYFAGRLAKAFSAEQALRGGFPVINREQHELAEGTLEDAVATQAWAREQYQEWSKPLDDFDQKANRRLSYGLLLARRTRSVPASDDPADKPAMLNLRPDQFDTLIAAFNASGAAMCALRDARPALTALADLRALEAGSQRPEQTAHRIAELMEQERLHRRQLEELLQSVPCPPIVGTSPTLSACCGLDSPETTMSQIANQLMRLHFGLLSHVTAVALSAETSSSLT